MKQKMNGLLLLLILLLFLFVGCGSASNPPDKSTGQTEDVESTENVEPTENMGEMTTESSNDAETDSEETTEENTTISTQEATEASTEESTEEETSKAPMIEIRLPIKEVKEPLYTFSWGAESGQVGWKYIPTSKEYVGPRSFAVEDGVLNILDNANDRIVIIEDGRITEIKSEYLGGGCELICQNQMIAVTFIGGDGVAIYRKDGTLVHMVDYSNVSNAPFITDLIEIGETYVVWYDWDAKALYRYDWVQDSGEYVEPDELNVEYLRGAEVNAPVTRDMVEVLGMDETGIYYFYPDIDTMRHYLICRETDDTQWITAWAFSGHKTSATSPFYYSGDGELYCMDCFEEQIVISKLTLE